MNIVVEIPFYSKTSGGIQHMMQLAIALNKKHRVHVRAQNFNSDLDYNKEISISYSVGLPDYTFPSADVVITYSDNPYTEFLARLPQVKKVIIYMLSYGMCIERERKNILNPKVVVTSSTLKIKKAIENEGIQCTCIGFGLDSKKHFFIENKIERSRYASLLYHTSPDKQYDLGVEICNKLQQQRLINGTIVFGSKSGFEKAKHPSRIISQYLDATQDEIRQVFNECSIFIMPSISEGLNLTPIEAALCGCPSVICDGAFDDVFFDGKTCIVAKKQDEKDIFEKSIRLLKNPKLATEFKKNIEKIIKKFTWEKTISNIERLF